MSAGEYCNRDVVIVERSESIRTAIELMRTHHVGDVVVVERTDGSSRPLGILTDRDIVMEVLAEDVDMQALSVGDVMSYEIQTVAEDVGLLDAIKVMRTKGVRRVPVVDSEGSLIGILAVDDVLALIAEQLSDLVGLITREQAQENRRRS